MKYRLIFDRSMQVMATAEIDSKFHVLTSTTYEIFDTVTSERLVYAELAFIPTFNPPKKMPNPKVRSVNNTMHLGAITKAQFIDKTLYIATSKGNILEVDPQTQYILNVIKLSDELIRDFIIAHTGNLIAATATSILLYTEQRTVVDVQITEPLRLYPSKKLPIQEKLPDRPVFNLCLVQTADEIGCLELINNELKLTGLFKNVFYEAIDLTQIGLIVAINAHKRIAAYGYNGKCYGKCEFSVKPRAFVMLANGGFMVYTYDDKLVQIFMKIIDNGRRVEFVENGLSSPRIQSIISTSCNMENLEYLEQVFEQKRPLANMFVGNKYVCVGRAHSAAIVDFNVYLGIVNGDERMQQIVPESKSYLNGYEYLMESYKNNQDEKVENQAFYDAMKIVNDNFKPQDNLIHQCKNKLLNVIKEYEDIFPDIVPDSLLDLQNYESAVDEAVIYMEKTEAQSISLLQEQFPKEIETPADVTMDLFNINPKVLKQFSETFDENVYLSEREKCLERTYDDLKKKVTLLIDAETKVKAAEVSETGKEEIKPEAKKLPSRGSEAAIQDEQELTYLKEQAEERKNEVINTYANAYWDVIENIRQFNMKTRLAEINDGLKEMNNKLDEFDYHLNRFTEGIARYEQSSIIERQMCEQLKEEEQIKAEQELAKLNDESEEQQGKETEEKEEKVEKEEPEEVKLGKDIIEGPQFKNIDPLKLEESQNKKEEKDDSDISEDDSENSFDEALEDVRHTVEDEKEQKITEKKKKLTKKEKRAIKQNEKQFIDIFDTSVESEPIISEEEFIHCFKAAMLAREAIYSTIVREKHLQVFDEALDDALRLIFLYLPDCCIVDKRFVLLPTEKLGANAWQTLLNGYDLKMHEFCSAKQVPSNLSGREFIRNFRALSHEGLLCYLGSGFSVNNSFYVFTQAEPKYSLTDVLEGKIKPFKTEEEIKIFVKGLLETINFLNSGDIKLLHRDLRPSTVFVDLSNDEQPMPKLYHIGFMQTVAAKEPAELDCIFAAPEVVCGGVTPGSDVWSIGTLCFKLLEELAGVKTRLFTPGTFDEKSANIPTGMTLQAANNSWVLSQMIEHSKDVEEVSKNHVIVMKENYRDLVLKECKIPATNAKMFDPVFGNLFWKTDEKGILREPKNNCLAKLYKKVDSDALDFIERCWCFMPSKRECAKEKLQHKWFVEPQEKKEGEEAKDSQ